MSGSGSGRAEQAGGQVHPVGGRVLLDDLAGQQRQPLAIGLGEADLGLVELPLDVGDERLGELPPPLGQPDADRPPVLRDDRAYSRLLRGT